MANYEPPSPLVFTIGTGYSPPDPFTIIVVGDDGSLTANGSISSPHDVVVGSGNAAVVCYGVVVSPLEVVEGVVQKVDGFVSPSLCIVEGAATSTFALVNVVPLTGSVQGVAEVSLGDSSVSVIPRREHVKAVGSSLANVASISPPASVVAAVGANSIVCWGVVKPKRSVLTSSGVGNVRALVAVAPGVDEISATGSSAVIANVKIFQRQSISSAAVVQEISGIGVGRIHPRTHFVSGRSETALSCVGTILHRVAIISGTATAGILCAGNIYPSACVVAGRSTRTALLAGYNRDIATVPTSSAPSLSALAFARVAVEPPTTTIIIETDILEFERI